LGWSGSRIANNWVRVRVRTRTVMMIRIVGQIRVRDS